MIVELLYRESYLFFHLSKLQQSFHNSHIFVRITIMHLRRTVIQDNEVHISFDFTKNSDSVDIEIQEQ